MFVQIFDNIVLSKICTNTVYFLGDFHEIVRLFFFMPTDLALDLCEESFTSKLLNGLPGGHLQVMPGG
jgi:hypothetical protein